MEDQQYMELALNLARAVKGQTSPNPPVGAVLVKEGEIVGLGAHLKSGEAHAEVHALEMAGERAKEAVLYVTLEPCCHVGKTPACTSAIIQSGVRRVVVATEDLHEKVAGQGIALLRRSGIEVTVGVCEAEARELLGEFFHYMTKGLPFVTMKVATSLDGKIATYTGESQWITGEEARFDVHRERHVHDAILVGVQTVIADDPSLTTRLPSGGKNPLRVVLDTNLRTPMDAKLVRDGEGPTVIFVGNGVKDERLELFTAFSQVEIIKAETKRVSPRFVLEELAKRGVMSILVEGGATVNDSFLQEGLVDQLLLYMAPKLIGGKEAPTAIGGEGFASLQEAAALEITSVERIGVDVKITAKRRQE